MHNADNFLSSFYYSLNYCQMPWCHCRPKGFVLKFVFVFIFFWLKLRIVQRRQARLKQGLKQAACEVYNANSQFLEQTKTIFFSITVSVFSITRCGDLSPNRRFMRPEKCQKILVQHPSIETLAFLEHSVELWMNLSKKDYSIVRCTKTTKNCNVMCFLKSFLRAWNRGYRIPTLTNSRWRG